VEREIVLQRVREYYEKRKRIGERVRLLEEEFIRR